MEQDMNTTRLLILGSLAAILPLGGADAQTRRDSLPRRIIAPRTPSATELLERRRDLDLTPRQIVRLDSIEREQFGARRAARERMLQLQDSICANRRPCVLTPEEGQRFRAEREQMRPQREQMMRADSAARSRAYAVLDSAQRTRLQTMREQRAMGQRASVMRNRMASPRGPRAQGLPREGMRGFDRERMRGFDRQRMRGFDRQRIQGERRMRAPDGRGAPMREPRPERRPGELDG